MGPLLGADRTDRLPQHPADRGAAAVEFALVLPLLLMLVCGVVDFGRALHTQLVLTQAAREGARLAALQQPDVVSRTQAAAVQITPVQVSVTSCPTTLTTADAVVSVQHQFTFVTPVALFGGPITLTGRGVMRCLG